MSNKTIPILNIRYQLTLDASPLCVPTPLTENHHGIVYLRTNQNICLAYNNCLKVHTGIILLSYPELILNTNPNITIETVAHCYSIPELQEEDGIEVIGPKILTSEFSDEIVVTIKNINKQIFYAEKGEAIAILELGFVPKADFILN